MLSYAINPLSGTVTLIPPSGSIVGSTFLLGAESWTIQVGYVRFTIAGNLGLGKLGTFFELYFFSL
jgi:hypothetical protein